MSINEKISPRKNPLINPYQIPNCNIVYDKNIAFVTDKSFNVFQQVPMNFVMLQPNNKFPQKFEAMYDQLIIFNGKLYFCSMNMIYNFNMFTITELAQIPGTEKKTEYMHMCIYQNQLLVTNNKKFFTFDDTTRNFTEIVFKVNNQPIIAESIQLMSYNGHSVASIKSYFDSNYRKYIVTLQQPNCKKLYAGKDIVNDFYQNSLAEFRIGDCYLVLDFTCQNKLKMNYTVKEFKGKGGIEYSQQGIQHIEHSRLFLLGSKLTLYDKNRDIAFQQIMKDQHADQLLAQGEQLQKLNKFKRSVILLPNIKSQDIYLMQTSQIVKLSLRLAAELSKYEIKEFAFREKK